jgi:hypothetical protein
MTDLAYLVLTVVAFGVFLLFVRACDQIIGPDGRIASGDRRDGGPVPEAAPGTRDGGEPG